jgi:hypothetical protein
MTVKITLRRLRMPAHPHRTWMATAPGASASGPTEVVAIARLRARCAAIIAAIDRKPKAPKT